MKKIIDEYRKIPLLVKLLLILILLIKIILLIQPSFKIDMNDWQAWAGRLVDIGPMKFYTRNIFADYLPFYYFFLWIITEIFSFIFGKVAIFSITFEIYIKIISNIFDVLTASTIFVIINKHSKKWATIGSFLYLINPSTIFNSSVWGQIDAIPTFFLTYSLYQLEERKNIMGSSITSALSFLIKPLNISILPIVLVREIKSFPVKKIIASTILAILVSFAIIIFFFPSDPIFGAAGHLFNSINMYPYTSLNAYNFWGLFGWWKPDATLWFNLSYHVWGYILYAFVLCIILIPYLRKKVKIETKFDYFACALSSFAFFLFLTRIHERHLFPVFALLIISACIFKSRVLIACYISLTVINFINLFYSYYYYNVIYNNPNASKNIIFDISANGQLIFSILSLVIFVIMFVVYFKNQKLVYGKK
jgi:Gpi18-like mannosyltransferase